MNPATRFWRPDWPCPVAQVWSPFRRGTTDPTYRVEGGRHWRAVRTPEGPATLAVTPLDTVGVIGAQAWGAGADWAVDQLPLLLGAQDDPSGFRPEHPVLSGLWRRYRHWRLGRTASIMDALIPAVIEQKVTGQEAGVGIRGLIAAYGEPAPGPGAALGLRLLPTADTLAMVPSWRWLQLGIDPARSRTLVRAARVARSLERALTTDPANADLKLRSLPGIGVWTSAEVRARALGDADAVSFGDYHVARDVGWALTGSPTDDAGLARLLEPYRPHRLRVQRLIGMAGLGVPRRGPRLAPRSHLPTRG